MVEFCPRDATPGNDVKTILGCAIFLYHYYNNNFKNMYLSIHQNYYAVDTHENLTISVNKADINML